MLVSKNELNFIHGKSQTLIELPGLVMEFVASVIIAVEAISKSQEIKDWSLHRI